MNYSLLLISFYFLPSQHKTGLCKNLLQAHTQKMKLPFPVYKTTRSGESQVPIFTSTVQVGDVFYTGGLATNRQEAEIKAAQKALRAFQIEACEFLQIQRHFGNTNWSSLFLLFNVRSSLFLFTMWYLIGKYRK